MQVTEGPDAGKLALLDFGLVAEIPSQDRAAMVSATIHLVRLGGGVWGGCYTDICCLLLLLRSMMLSYLTILIPLHVLCLPALVCFWCGLPLHRPTATGLP